MRLPRMATSAPPRISTSGFAPKPRTRVGRCAPLQAFGAPLHGLTEVDLARPGVIFQIGVPPLRIDVITIIDGVEFEAAWQKRVATKFAGEPGYVLSIADLIANKRAAGRLQDLADVEQLERLLARQKPSGG